MCSAEHNNFRRCWQTELDADCGCTSRAPESYERTARHRTQPLVGDKSLYQWADTVDDTNVPLTVCGHAFVINDLYYGWA